MTDIAVPEITIHPVLATPEPPKWSGASWVGEIYWDATYSDHTPVVHRPSSLRLYGAEGYRHARLLVRTGTGPLGFVALDVVDGLLDVEQLRRRLAELPSPDATTSAGAPTGEVPTPAITVVICTRDRVAMLQTALDSVLALEYPNFEVIVVDNAAATDATRRHVEALGDPRVRVIEEPRPGLSRARNAGLLAAAGDVVAFTDDDVVVDRHWLSAVARGFTRGRAVSCVSGLVPAAELRTPAQAYFDSRVGWSECMSVRVFDRADPPADIPLFPFAVGHYGTGANFAVDRDVLLRLGGFDEALGRARRPAAARISTCSSGCCVPAVNWCTTLRRSCGTGTGPAVTDSLPRAGRTGWDWARGSPRSPVTVVPRRMRSRRQWARPRSSCATSPTRLPHRAPPTTWPTCCRTV